MDDKYMFFPQPEGSAHSEASSSSTTQPNKDKEFLEQCLEALKDCLPETMSLEERRINVERMYQALKPLIGLDAPNHVVGGGALALAAAIASGQYDRTYGLQDVQDLIHMAFDSDYCRGRKEHQKSSWLIDVLQVAFSNRLFSVMCFLTNDLKINCFEFIRIRDQYDQYKDEIFAILNSDELLALSQDPEGTLMAKHALDYAIGAVSTDCVERLVENNPSIVGFAHIHASLDTRFTLSQKMMDEKKSIFDFLTKHYALSQEELDQSLCIASTNYKISLSTVKTLLDRGANPSYLYLNTPEHTLGFGNIKLVETDTFKNREIKKTSALLEACANVFDTHVLNEEDHLKLIQLLLDKGANPNLRLDDAGHHTVFQLVTLLWCDSAKLGSSSPQVCNKVLKMLIRSGANPDVQNKQENNCFDLLREVEEGKAREFSELYEQSFQKERASCILL